MNHQLLAPWFELIRRDLHLERLLQLYASTCGFITRARGEGETHDLIHFTEEAARELEMLRRRIFSPDSWLLSPPQFVSWVCNYLLLLIFLQRTRRVLQMRLEGEGDQASGEEDDYEGDGEGGDGSSAEGGDQDPSQDGEPNREQEGDDREQLRDAGSRGEGTRAQLTPAISFADVIQSMASELLRCFLAGLKHRMNKSAPLPFDVGQFYARYLLPCVPANRRLDMKKTKYKKFATFLDEVNKMESSPTVKIQGKGKGNDVIAAIGPTIHEVLSLTEPLMPLVRTWKKAEKGQTTPQELREGVTTYVKAQNLSEGKLVRMDPLLAQLARSNETTMDWNMLNQKIQGLATPTFIVELPDKRKIVYKLKAPKIHLKTENRIGNKKVTIVNNCEMLGVEAKELAHRLQVGVAASASVIEACAPFTGNCIQLQGSQVAFVSTMLTTEYGIDKKYIDGFELPDKKKKKK